MAEVHLHQWGVARYSCRETLETLWQQSHPGERFLEPATSTHSGTFCFPRSNLQRSRFAWANRQLFVVMLGFHPRPIIRGRVDHDGRLYSQLLRELLDAYAREPTIERWEILRSLPKDPMDLDQGSINQALNDVIATFRDCGAEDHGFFGVPVTQSTPPAPSLVSMVAFIQHDTLSEQLTREIESFRLSRTGSTPDLTAEQQPPKHS